MAPVRPTLPTSNRGCGCLICFTVTPQISHPVQWQEFVLHMFFPKCAGQSGGDMQSSSLRLANHIDRWYLPDSLLAILYRPEDVPEASNVSRLHALLLPWGTDAAAHIFEETFGVCTIGAFVVLCQSHFHHCDLWMLREFLGCTWRLRNSEDACVLCPAPGQPLEFEWLARAPLQWWTQTPATGSITCCAAPVEEM